MGLGRVAGAASYCPTAVNDSSLRRTPARAAPVFAGSPAKARASPPRNPLEPNRVTMPVCEDARRRNGSGLARCDRSAPGRADRQAAGECGSGQSRASRRMPARSEKVTKIGETQQWLHSSCESGGVVPIFLQRVVQYRPMPSLPSASRKSRTTTSARPAGPRPNTRQQALQG